VELLYAKSAQQVNCHQNVEADHENWRITKLVSALDARHQMMWHSLDSFSRSNEDGITPFHILCARGNWPVAQFFLEGFIAHHF